jgi:putative proteasome-type protease
LILLIGHLPDILIGLCFGLVSGAKQLLLLCCFLFTKEWFMSYCLGIKTQDGLVMASDSRTSAGADQVNTCQKMYRFEMPDERVFVILTTGSLSVSQSLITLLRTDFSGGLGLAAAATFYDAVREVGAQMRAVSEIDREYLQRDGYSFNVHILIGGQIKNQEHELYMIYPQGNPLRSTEDSPFLQIGEAKYGRPILDRGVRGNGTTLHEAAKYALLSIDSTIRSNATVGPPVDILVYGAGELHLQRHRRFGATDPDLMDIHSRWEQSLRRAVSDLPGIQFNYDQE